MTLKQKIIDIIIISLVGISLYANVMLGLFVMNNHTLTENLYSMNAKVLKVDKYARTVTFEDSRGHLWQTREIEDWVDGEKCIIIFDNWGTVDTIEDDKIIRINAAS